MQINSTSEFVVVESRGESSGGEFVVEDSFGYLMNFSARVFARSLAECLAAHDISVGQWSVMLILWARDGLSQRELSRRVAIEDATMVRTIDRMERDGLVRRERDEGDRRRMNIFLTEKGSSLRDSLVPCAVAVNETATHSFTEDEKQQLRGFLRRMISSLEKPPSGRVKGGGNDGNESVE